MLVLLQVVYLPQSANSALSEWKGRGIVLTTAMDDGIELDFDPIPGDDDVVADAVHESTETFVQDLPPASVVESKLQEEKPAVNRHRRIRYRSASSDSSRSGSRPRYYPSPLRLRRFHDESTKAEAKERRIQRAKRFGIQPPTGEYTISQDELLELYESMGIDPDDDNVRLHSVYVRGIDDLSEFQIEKIFAEFSPMTVELIDGASCNVIWHDAYIAGKMMLEMTKPLKRVRGGRIIEEGEVAESSDEEEGEMKEEHGDDVTIRMNKALIQKNEAAKATEEFVEVDIDQVVVPPGKWRVITKHVGQNRLIILRFSCREDIRKGHVGQSQRRQCSVPKDSVDRDGYSYKWTNRKNRVRPGLNIFNKDGDELEWDYEHDTRFYVDLDAPEKTPAPAACEKRWSPSEAGDSTSKEVILGKRAIKSRGRGSKRFKSLEGGASMAADEEEMSQVQRRRRMVRDWQDEANEQRDSDLSSDRDPSPTPQPWDARNTSVRLRTTRSLSSRRHYD
uniref:Nuclear cap-binding protein subunit 3 n=2 Tax=Ascaris suum TaxID=6253 RepID=F1L2T0_ASCSU